MSDRVGAAIPLPPCEAVVDERPVSGEDRADPVPQAPHQIWFIVRDELLRLAMR